MNTRRDARLSQYFSPPSPLCSDRVAASAAAMGKKVQKSLDGMDRRIWGYEALPGGGVST